MRSKMIAGVAALATALLLTVFAPMTAQTSAQAIPNGPWLDRIVWAEEGDRSKALTEIIEGLWDTIIFDVTAPADKARALASSEIYRFLAPGIFDNFLMNPSRQDPGFPENPFAISAVRASMQLLIDRDFIVREIWSGFAIPRFTALHPVDGEYARAISDVLPLEDKWGFDPQAGKDMMFTALQDAGWSIGADNLWHDSNGLLVTIKGSIRTQDERLQMGAYYADLLRGLNFQVLQMNAPDASKFPYASLPDQNLWHFYTAGWIGSFAAFDDAATWRWTCTIQDGAYCAHTVDDLLDPEHFVINPELADISDTLAFALYDTLAERKTLMARGLELMMEEPIRVFIDARQGLYVFNNRFQDPILDLHGALLNEWSLASAQVPVDVGGQFDGEQVARVLNLIMFVDGWNPWQDDTWLYDEVQRQQMVDVSMQPHPHTGRWIDIRSEVTVNTAGPTGTLDVPTDAMVFDVVNNEWVLVAPATTATSVVANDLILGQWHHGVDITMEDILYSLSDGYRRSFGDISEIDSLASTATGGAIFFYEEQLKGVRVVDADTVELYIDYFHVDEQEIAATGSVFPTYPWEVAELAFKTMFDLETALDQQDAANTGRFWLDLTKGDSLAVLDADFATLKAANWKPPGFDTAGGLAFIDDATATARWAALEAFHTARGHYWPSNGPFILDKVDIANRQTIMVADRNYPFTADKWDSLTTIGIPGVTFAPTPPVVIAGTPGIFDFSVNIGPSPTDDFTATYVVRDLNTGEFVIEDEPTRLGTGSYRIEISSTTTEQFLLGNFEIISVIVGNAAAVPIITRQSFLVLPSVEFFTALLDARATLIEGEVVGLADDLATTNTNLQANSDAVGGLTGLLTAIAILAVIAIAVAVVSIVLMLRRSAGGG